MIGKLISKHALAVIASRPADFPIGPTDDPYMLRWWWLPRNRYFNVYIHRIRHDDDDRALHDHPWASLSFMIEGEIIEHHKMPHRHWSQKRILKAGRWVYRSSKFAHRLTLASKSATTVFITGPRLREWGFHCPKGWVHWKDFVAKDNKGAVGGGCGEVDE